MSGRKKLRKAIREFSDRKQDQNPILSGRLGTLIDGHQIVEVSDRPGFVWVRVRGSESELIQAYNATVSPIYDLPVLITRDEVNPRVYRIIGRDVARYANWGDTAYLPKHATQHQFPSTNSPGGGGDIVW